MHTKFLTIITLVGFGLALNFAPHQASAQSAAAAQVCADILSQYGITPEGCDFNDTFEKQEKAAAKAAPAAAPTAPPNPELEENNIFFRVGGDKLDQRALQKLDTLTLVLNTQVLGDACLRLVGHSDASGAAETNERMGLKRANVVAAYLRPKLNDPRRIAEIRSDGESNLLPTEPPESARHRRVTLYARKCPQP